MNFSLSRPGRKLVRQLTANSSASVATGRHSSPDGDWDQVDLSSTEYARRRRELMQLISDLRSMGAQTLVDLPSIVVIGGQSAGKSSLVEAVSGVNVPRDSGTCTRCPMECTMSTSATTWSCKIKLRFDYDSSGHFAAQQREIAFGPAITDKKEMDVWLRRAQTAILNPDLLPESFYRKSIQDLRSFTSTNSLKFSRNVVSIFIEDPVATDLSFVDLPGLIQNEDTDVVDLVRQLTESYISQPNTIILTTIPMSDDMQNQQSVRLAREADPEGERTIGVLTKPDMLGDGAVNARKLWLDVIEGRQHKLKHGYHCVRLPDDAQRQQGLSRSALQRIGAEFFDSTSPWSGVTDRGRFGVPAFVSDISVLLVNHIRRVLPQLREDIERLLASCLKEIGTLPKPLEADPQTEVLVRVNKFCDALRGVVSGNNSDKSLAQRNRALYTIFAQDIRGTAPDFRPFEQPERYTRVDALEPEEAAVVANDHVETMGVYDVRKTIKESTGWELPGNIPYEAKTRLINQFTVLWLSPAEKCLTSINDVLDDVIQQLIKTHFGRFRVLQDLVAYVDLYSLCEGLMQNLIRPDIEEHKNGTLSATKATLELEKSLFYTQNLNDFQNLRGKWLAKYRYARRNQTPTTITATVSIALPANSVCDTYYGVEPTSASPVNARRTKTQTMFTASASATPVLEADPASPVDKALRYLAQAGYKGLTVDDLARLSPPDEFFDDELIVMADVRAYFTIACKRIIDHVPLKIEHSLHHALSEKLSVSLLQRLMADTASTGNPADRMRELVSEDPATEANRIRLEAMRNRLQEMKRKLANFAA